MSDVILSKAERRIETDVVTSGSLVQAHKYCRISQLRSFAESKIFVDQEMLIVGIRVQKFRFYNVAMYVFLAMYVYIHSILYTHTHIHTHTHTHIQRMDILQQVHSLFQTKFSTECHRVLPISISSSLSFPSSE